MNSSFVLKFPKCSLFCSATVLLHMQEHQLLLDDKTRQIDAVYRIENSSSGMGRV